MTRSGQRSLLWPVTALVVAVVVIGALVTGRSSTTSHGSHPTPVAPVDPGTRLSGRAPDFTLTDQFERRVSLHDLRGRAVLLAFSDSECTTVCPLMTQAMVNAQRLLGRAGAQVALLGVDANPAARTIADVRAYSAIHEMTHRWRFLTGSLAALRRVWHAYKIDVAIEHGQIDHTPALFLIDPAGRLRSVYVTQVAYSSVDQQAQVLARAIARVLPSHPAVASRLSLARIPPIPPTARATLPRAGGGTLTLGPGAPRLLAFFSTWDAQVMPLGAELRRLGVYARTAAVHGLPRLVAVDGATTEPSPTALSRFLAPTGPLGYPVAIDRTGRLADGYGVQDEPWLVLVSATGRILWYYDVATSGWLAPSALARQVRAAIARPRSPRGSAAVRAALAGSPAPLAALHAQAGRIVRGFPALQARLRALRGYPVVVNAWASWCGPCRGEFGLFAAASARFGRRVAFVGANTQDSTGDAQAFLAGHPVSYPSYSVPSTSALSPLAPVFGLPTTIFVNRAGKVTYVHSGQYVSQGTLDADVAAHAR